ncbi:MAG TPA: helix-turn-helix domain-containing protein [Nannocystaceae bacterium]|nr:helix-turn-helix domain-containing protein [Nannocystaceae bacterium]
MVDPHRATLEAVDATQPLPPLLTVAEAAELARVDPSTMRTWIAAERVEATKPSRRWLVKRDSLLAVIGLVPKCVRKAG